MKAKRRDGHLPTKGRGLRMRATLLTFRSWVYSVSNCEEMNFCYLSQPVWVLCMAAVANILLFLT